MLQSLTVSSPTVGLLHARGVVKKSQLVASKVLDCLSPLHALVYLSNTQLTSSS